MSRHGLNIYRQNYLRKSKVPLGTIEIKYFGQIGAFRNIRDLKISGRLIYSNRLQLIFDYSNTHGTFPVLLTRLAFDKFHRLQIHHILLLQLYFLFPE